MIAGFDQCGPLHQRWDAHPHCELVHTESGTGTFQVGAACYELTPGTTLIVKANRPHETRVADGRRLRGIVMHFAPQSLLPEVERIDAPALFAASGAVADELHRLFTWCLRENHQMGFGAQRVADSLLSIILVLCLRAAEETGQPTSADAVASASDRRIAEACSRYVNAHFAEPLTLTRVANEIGASPFHLSHVFSRYTGVTFTEFLTDMRMTHARAMVVQCALPLREVAARCGFSDVYYFGKVFKRHFRVPPGAYRKRFAAAAAAASTAAAQSPANAPPPR